MSEKDFVDLLNEEMKELIENLPQVKQLKAEIERLKEDNKRLNGLLVSGTESLDYWTNKYLEEQAKNTELQKQVDELKKKIDDYQHSFEYLKGFEDGEEIATKDTAEKYHDIMEREFMKSNNSNFYEFWCNFNNNVVKEFGV